MQTAKFINKIKSLPTLPIKEKCFPKTNSQMGKVNLKFLNYLLTQPILCKRPVNQSTNTKIRMTMMMFKTTQILKKVTFHIFQSQWLMQQLNCKEQDWTNILIQMIPISSKMAKVQAIMTQAYSKTKTGTPALILWTTLKKIHLCQDLGRA